MLARSAAALLADRADQLGLAHLRAALYAKLRRPPTQLGDRHRTRPGAGAGRRPALARRGLRALAAEGGARFLGQLRDGALLARARLRSLHVLAGGVALLLCRHGGMPSFTFAVVLPAAPRGESDFGRPRVHGMTALACPPLRAGIRWTHPTEGG